MARRKKKVYRKKSKSFMGFGMNDLFIGAGVGLSGTIGGLANNYFPQLAGNTAQAVAGLAGMYLFKRGPLKFISKGVIYKAIGDVVEDQIAPKLLGMIGGLGGSSSTAGTSVPIV
jgi:hypothetical protein